MMGNYHVRCGAGEKLEITSNSYLWQVDCTGVVLKDYNEHSLYVERLKHEALKQIHENKYYAGLEGEVLLVGIAHDKKVCQLVHELINFP